MAGRDRFFTIFPDQVNAMNKAGLMIDIMKMELGKFANVKRKFIEEFSVHDYNYIEKVKMLDNSR